MNRSEFIMAARVAALSCCSGMVILYCYLSMRGGELIALGELLSKGAALIPLLALLGFLIAVFSKCRQA